MAQTTILAAGDTAADSSDVSIASGARVTLSLFSADALPLSCFADIYIKQPGGTITRIGGLSQASPSMAVTSPGVYFVRRYATSNPGVNVGVAADA